MGSGQVGWTSTRLAGKHNPLCHLLAVFLHNSCQFFFYPTTCHCQWTEAQTATVTGYGSPRLAAAPQGLSVEGLAANQQHTFSVNSRGYSTQESRGLFAQALVVAAGRCGANSKCLCIQAVC